MIQHCSDSSLLYSKIKLLASLILSLLFCGTSLSAHSTRVDSFFKIKNELIQDYDYFQTIIEASKSSSDNDLENFEQIVPELFIYMESVNQAEVWRKGLTSIGQTYRNFNELAKADSIIQLAKKYCSTKDNLFETYLESASISQRMGHPKECLILLDTIFNHLNVSNQNLEHLNLHMLRGICCLDSRKISEALKSFLTIKELTNDRPEYKKSFDASSFYLAKTYAELNSFERALDIHKERRNDAHKRAEYTDELFTYFDILFTTLALQDYEQTIIEGHRAIALKNKYHVSMAFGFIYHCMGDAFTELNQLDSALYYIQKGISLSRKTKEHKELADNLSTKSKILISQGKYQEAKIVTEEAISLRDFDDQNLLNYYSIIQANLGDHSKAYAALRTNWDNWLESQQTNESGKIASLLVEEKFKMENDQQQRQFEQEIKSQTLRNTIGLLTLFLLMVAGYLYLQMKNNSQLRQLNRSLSQQNQALEQFAHITSHDLKEPVRNISIFSDLLLRKTKVVDFDEDEKNYIQFIQSSAKNLFRMIESLKTFTEVSFTKQKSEKVDIKEVIGIVSQNLRQLIDENNVTLEFNNPYLIDSVKFPKELLILAIQNLIQNGIKYNHSKNPKIEVTVAMRNNETIFEISDNGIGIDPVFFDQIFVPFKTLSNKFDTQSSGLGLSICKNIIENHGGKIWVESNEHSGSSFYFSIL